MQNRVNWFNIMSCCVGTPNLVSYGAYKLMATLGNTLSYHSTWLLETACAVSFPNVIPEAGMLDNGPEVPT